MGRNSQRRRATRHGARRMGAVGKPSLAGNRLARRHGVLVAPPLALDSGGDSVEVEATVSSEVIE